MLLKTFRWPFGITLIALVGALLVGGPEALVLVAILTALEISLSFDNAVVNATVLERMDAYWQRIFLTLGVIIAVFGMRLIFPLVIVSLTAHISPGDVIHLALKGGSVDDPGTYAYLLKEAHPTIAAFGGMFLGMLFLDFIFEEREVTWLAWLERPLARIGKLDQLSVVIALIALVVAAKTSDGNESTIIVAGVVGVVLYILVNGLGELFEAGGEEGDEDVPGIHGDAYETASAIAASGSLALATGKAALFLFLYLEVLDASFSFDGVIGAFAITQNIFVIAVGLGVGAFYIRSLTVYLVRKGTLKEYIYLEHGANWAIGSLAAILLVGVKHEVPDVITGLVGVAFIGLAFATSVPAARRARADDDDQDGDELSTTTAGV